MIDEPYRWLEAIANRREYIQDQLKTGSPIILVGYDNGLLLATIGREHQKLFEVYDRVAFSAIGHPADIEKLRMVGIDLAHVEGSPAQHRMFLSGVSSTTASRRP